MREQQQQRQQSPPVRYHRSSLSLVRVFASIVLVSVLLLLIRNLYSAMYRESRSEAISHDLNFFYHDDNNNDDSDKARKNTNQVARRDRILRLRKHMGVNRCRRFVSIPPPSPPPFPPLRGERKEENR